MRLWNLGDMVGYGARPNEVLELLRSAGETERFMCAAITTAFAAG
jgi:hypothetical protein